ncbi:FAD-dependent monooxygenase [Bacillus toyonensis]|uniref:FAD-dependent monooxygenase n=1 Tax=Bacillus toyonensis TaxID=155322 RepID=UPI000BF6BFE5|nr:FAD-dependent monooxygenase [Bacillus toyonensis]PEO80703.1 monooxygenase [Bacillus toyonensis]
MKVLISGGGIAGLTLANCLLSNGYSPTIIEKAHSFRSIGSVISLRGDALFVLDKLGLLEQVKQKGVTVEMREFVDKEGQELRKIDFRKFHIQQGGSISIHRFVLHQILYESIRNSIDIKFNTTIRSFHQNSDRVEVTFHNGRREFYDLVIGTDGIHSVTRNLLMKDEYMKQLDIGFSVFTIPRPVLIPEKLKKNQTLETLLPGCYIHCGMDDTYIWGMFIYKNKYRERFQDKNNKEFLLELCKDIQWGIRDVIENISNVDLIFQDKMTLVQLHKWSEGRIALLGDAAHAMTFMSGTSGGKSMLGAYRLTQELINCPSYEEAFYNYESYLKYEIEKIQQKSIKAAKFSSSDHHLMKYFKIAMLKHFPTSIMNSILKKLFIVKPQNYYDS